MGNLVNLRHIVTNNTKRLGSQFVKDLYLFSQSENILRSNILYRVCPNYIRIEYVAKSIPRFIYKNEILRNESIITIYSSDFGLTDSFIIFNSQFSGDFNYKRTYFEYDKIELEGEKSSISNFLNYLNKTNHINYNSEKWIWRENGTIQLNTHNAQLFFASPSIKYELIEDTNERKSLIENNFELISISNSSQILSERFVSCFYNLINEPEEFNGLQRLKFMRRNKVIAMIDFDENNNEWAMLQQHDLFPFVSNNELVDKLNEISYI